MDWEKEGAQWNPVQFPVSAV